MTVLRAAGYLTTFIPPAAICASATSQSPALGLVVLLFLLPLLRSLFGDTKGRVPEWSESIATFLHWLPAVCALAYAIALLVGVWTLARGVWTRGEMALFGVSLWAGFIFGTCVAHELIHRRDALSRNTGRILSGMIGYPFLEHDHHLHHRKNGDTQAAECAHVTESAWGFTWRRLKTVIPSVLAHDAVMASRRGHRLAGGLPLAICTTALTAAAFASAGGFGGLMLYVFAAIATGWALQAMTYVQHWGLEAAQQSTASGLGWEDRCQLQAWLTFSISFHQSHHLDEAVPYYRQEVSGSSPKAPAGYVILFFASLVPPLWRALMVPALERWKLTPGSQPTAGRGLICLR